MIYLVTGGSGSGKSAYAEKVALECQPMQSYCCLGLKISEAAIILPRCRYMEKKAKKG